MADFSLKFPASNQLETATHKTLFLSPTCVFQACSMLLSLVFCGHSFTLQLPRN